MASKFVRARLLAFVAMGTACADEPFAVVGDSDALTEETHTIWLQTRTNIDLLLVVDDSAAMAGAQARLSESFGAFVGSLEAAEIDAEYRIGVTSTDAANPWCAQTEVGAMRVSSCRARPQDFGTQDLDVEDEACSDACSFDAITTLPTITEFDPVPRPRPWIERIAGRSNLAHMNGRTPTMGEALACMGPQGITGCAFPSPLEAMHEALMRVSDPEDPQYGFLRFDATLVVALITSGSDCSLAPEHAADWPGTDEPTRAECWNAGVACSGGPGTYDECHAADDGVLHPVSRYVDLLASIERTQQEIFPNQQVVLGLVAGVPPGYEDGNGEIVYADAADPLDQQEYGIGAGCVTPGTEPRFLATPPVREREVVEAFEVRDASGETSICADDYAKALGPIVDHLAVQPKPPCVPTCVADVDPDTSDLDPACTLERESPRRDGGLDRLPLPACDHEGALPDGEDGCYLARTDRDLSDYCVEQGYNLEFAIVWRDGVHIPNGTTVTATCAVSDRPRLDCPQGR